jgi:ketosteroid isomerase-like protein
VRKDHITDWITSQTSKGRALKSVEFRPASMRVKGNVAVVYYWIKFAWLGKDGKDATYAARITHTWLKTGKDWRIIGGMSMLEPKQ